MNSIEINGIKDGDAYDDRVIIFLGVNYNGEKFDWSIRMPANFAGSFQDFVDLRANSVYADIQAKLQAWEDLDPKTREIEHDLIHGDKVTITVPVERSEIVQPTYPDYYVLRAREYPPIEEQLDAFWKGNTSLENMKTLISNIKAKYPKL